MHSDIDAQESTLAPHLTVTGGNKALDFYQAAFGAMVMDKVTADDGSRVCHAVLRIHNSLIFLSDEFPENGAGAIPSPATLGGTPVALQLSYPTTEEADAAFRRAVDAGAEILTPMTDLESGTRFGRLRDPFGHVWSFVGPLALS